MNKSVIKLWLFFVVFFPLTLSLGFWQLDRAEQKKDLLTMQEQALAMPPGKLNLPIGALAEYSRWSLTGRYVDKHFLLDNRTRNGKVGYEVLTLFELEQGGFVLVNRGWIVAPRLRTELPDVRVQDAMIDLTVSTKKRSSNDGVVLYAEAGWPKRIQAVNMDAISGVLGSELPKIEFRILEPGPGALELGWSVTHVSPEKHHGYAVQWFSLSFALSLLTGLATWKFWRKID